MNILGTTHPISWNNAACLLIDGRLVAFAEEERFTRMKHAPRVYPQHAVNFCLRQAGLKPQDVDATAIGFERPIPGSLTTQQIAEYRAGTLTASSMDVQAAHLAADLEIQAYGARYYFDHHRAHAASAFQPSGFPEANVISLDGWGGRLSGLFGVQRRGEPLHVMGEVSPDKSWGDFYALITDRLGFRAHSAEGKTMGLAPYGVPDAGVLPDWCDETFGLPDVERYYAFLSSHVPRRDAREPLTEFHKNLASTLQHYYERSLLRIARHLHAHAGSRNFVLAGGVALNCTANGKLAREEFVDGIFVQPASHDAGTALGAAILAHEQLTGRSDSIGFDHAYWGPDYTDDDIGSALRAAGIEQRQVDPVTAAVSALMDNRMIGWFQGRAEVGPRALGGRSMLADASDFGNLDRVNRIKRREPWRPLAPSVLEERFLDVFELRHLSPFMLLAGRVRDAWAGRVPAVVHVDGSARPQAVGPKTNPLFHRLLSTLESQTGIPVLLNTSFNLDGEPLVNSPDDALATFFRSGLDALLIGNFLVER